MAILTLGGVTKRCAALLDDPGQRRFSSAYLAPYIDQENESLEIYLERLGVLQQESIAIFNWPAATNTNNGATNPPFDLTPAFAAGQPLQWFLRPRYVEWKVQGQPDTNYDEADMVDKIDDVQIGNLGCQQYKWSGATLYLTPSFTPVTLRITFFALANDLYDPAQPVMRGIGNLLALQAATFVCSLNNQMGKLGEKLEKNLSRDKQNFTNLIQMANQAQNIFPRSTKRGVAVQISAGNVPYS
jgi:hypothetical protein